MTGIRFNESTGVFSLDTAGSSYRMQVGRYGVLLHLYYGANVGDSELTDQIVLQDRGNSPNYYECGEDRTYSPDQLPQEYTGYGCGDYRICSVEAEYEDGSIVTDLRYESYRILEGKYALSGMPAMFALPQDKESGGAGSAQPQDMDCQTLEITLRDRISGLKAVLLYGVFPQLDIITRAVRIENGGKAPFELRKVMSLQLDLPDIDDWIHFHGRHAMERNFSRSRIDYGIQGIESRRVHSSHQHNPFVCLSRRDTTEDFGECYGICFVYSGGFECRIERDQTAMTRLTMGIHPWQFCWKLEPGECFEAPEVMMTWSGEGFSGMTHRLHDAMRTHLIRSRYVSAPRPVLVNNWEATYFRFNADKLVEIAATAKKAGVDLFVLDDGWFGKRDSDYSGLGDWIPNEEKLQGSLAQVSERIRALDMKFGLWVEPEMISEDSDLYRKHPDWCLTVPGRDPFRGRSQLNLDVSREEVRRHVMDQICRVIDECHISYIKWDMNRSVGNLYSAGLSAQRQGELSHRYVLGVYAMMEELVSRYPDLLFENCAGGGGRFDAGMLYYSPQIWCSDNTDAIDRLSIQYGTSFAYPVSTMGAHVSVCPNHQSGRVTPAQTRAVVASAGTFGYELDLTKCSSEQLEMVSEQIDEYRRIAPLMQNGDYYRLIPPSDPRRITAWEYVSKDQSQVLMQAVIVRAQANPIAHRVYLRGLDEKAHYREKTSGNVYTGAALMHAGLPLPPMIGDFQSAAFWFDRV